jgi:hypothetical protein
MPYSFVMVSQLSLSETLCHILQPHIGDGCGFAGALGLQLEGSSASTGLALLVDSFLGSVWLLTNAVVRSVDKLQDTRHRPRTRRTPRTRRKRRTWARRRHRIRAGYADAVISPGPNAVASQTNSRVPSDEVIIREGAIFRDNEIASIVGSREVEVGAGIDETGLGGAGLMDASGCGRSRWLDCCCSRHADAVVGLSPDATACWSDCGVPSHEIVVCEGAVLGNDDFTLVVGFGEVEVGTGLNHAGLRRTGLLDAGGRWFNGRG